VADEVRALMSITWGQYLLDGQAVVNVERRDADSLTTRDAFVTHEDKGANEAAIQRALHGGAVTRGACHVFMYGPWPH
jgi:hypothetical protein